MVIYVHDYHEIIDDDNGDDEDPTFTEGQELC